MPPVSIIAWSLSKRIGSSERRLKKLCCDTVREIPWRWSNSEGLFSESVILSKDAVCLVFDEPVCGEARFNREGLHEGAVICLKGKLVCIRSKNCSRLFPVR